MPVMGRGAEMTGEPGELGRRCVGHVGVDGNLDESRAR